MLDCSNSSVWRGMLDCSSSSVWRGMLDCSSSSVWRGMLDCSSSSVWRGRLDYAAASPQSTFIILNLKNFRLSDFNKELTSSLKMIRIMIETCCSVFKCFNINILD